MSDLDTPKLLSANKPLGSCPPPGQRYRDFFGGNLTIHDGTREILAKLQSFELRFVFFLSVFPSSESPSLRWSGRLSLVPERGTDCRSPRTSVGPFTMTRCRGSSVRNEFLFPTRVLCWVSFRRVGIGTGGRGEYIRRPLPHRVPPQPRVGRFRSRLLMGKLINRRPSLGPQGHRPNA